MGCLKSLSNAVRLSEKEAIKQTSIYCQVIVKKKKYWKILKNI